MIDANPRMTHAAATETDLADIEVVAADSRRRQTALLLSAVGLLGVLSSNLLKRLYVITTTLSNLEPSAEAASEAGTASLRSSPTGDLPGALSSALLLASIVGIGYGLRTSRKARTLHAALLARGTSLDIPLLPSEVVGGLRVAAASGDGVTLVRARPVGWRKFVNSWMALLGVLALATAVASILLAVRAAAPNSPFGSGYGWLSKALSVVALLIGTNALLRLSLRPFATEVAARGHGAGATLRITFARLFRPDFTTELPASQIERIASVMAKDIPAQSLGAVLRPSFGGQPERTRTVWFGSTHAAVPIAKWRADRLTRSLNRALGIAESAPPANA
jgi:hypothetical protein